jgi:hypothetical protein
MKGPLARRNTSARLLAPAGRRPDFVIAELDHLTLDR